MKPLSECSLYTFVDTAYLRGRAPEEIARQLCAGGSDLIQLRAKTLVSKEIRAIAEAILPITRAANVGLVINDDLVVAREVGAEFCHLGQEDFFDNPFVVRALACPGPQRQPKGWTTNRIGLSSHAPEQARRAIAAGPAYVAIGPVYPTATKPSAKPVTLDYVRWAAANVCIPWFAIGGINLKNLDDVLEAGAKRICVVSALLDSDDVARTCQQFKQRLGSAS